MLRATALRLVLILGVMTLCGGCAFHSTATRWNGHVGPDGAPVFVMTSTYLGVNLVGLVPFIGKTTIDDMVDESTRWIVADDGGQLRLVETENSNYWYGVPPLSWFLSPVITSVTFEYKPSAAALAKAGVAENALRAAEPQR